MSNSSIEEAKATFYDEMTLIGTDKAEYYTSWSAMEASIEAQMQIADPKFEQRNRRVFVSDDGTNGLLYRNHRLFIQHRWQHEHDQRCSQ